VFTKAEINQPEPKETPEVRINFIQLPVTSTSLSRFEQVRGYQRKGNPTRSQLYRRLLRLFLAVSSRSRIRKSDNVTITLKKRLSMPPSCSYCVTELSGITGLARLFLLDSCRRDEQASTKGGRWEGRMQRLERRKAESSAEKTGFAGVLLYDDERGSTSCELGRNTLLLNSRSSLCTPYLSVDAKCQKGVFRLPPSDSPRSQATISPRV
jgi:hypothetical protein